MGRYGHEIDPHVSARLGARAARARPQQIRKPLDQSDVDRNQRLKHRKVLIRGRFDHTGQEVWDVIEVLGGKAERVYAAGIREVGEALEMGVACKQGRVMVSLGFNRMEVKTSSGGLIVPSNQIIGGRKIPYRPVPGQKKTFEVGDA